MEEPIRILFLCTGNSARSIMAEALANARFGEHVRARSAGSAPRGEIHPLARATLHENGIATDGLASEHWDRYRDELFDLVVTLCGEAAREACPTFPGSPRTVHWGFPDPPAAADPAGAFDDVFQGLCEALEIFTGALSEGTGVAAERAAALVRRLTPAEDAGL